MREASDCPPLDGPASDPVLYGVAFGLERLFPPIEHPCLEHGSEIGSDADDAMHEETRDQR
ncbi:hypothetical protein F6X53_31330 [Methylobacterium soli]|uniref:Uncharacterized protein n=1 Tax=Methylobacterium soli TaxID=553447 RepID=A0A6L3SNE9_9HYPH|nr:hypothetical protein F6X53_31330 [Methylobacterium soli]